MKLTDEQVSMMLSALQVREGSPDTLCCGKRAARTVFPKHPRHARAFAEWAYDSLGCIGLDNEIFDGTYRDHFMDKILHLADAGFTVADGA